MTERNIPVFVKINDYKEILDIVDVMKQKIKETDASMEKIRQLKIQEDREIKDWDKNMDEIVKRLEYIDRAFFEDQNG